MKLLPYIGVLESHSVSRIKRLMIDGLVRRNLRVYKKCHCLVKTPAVEKQLKSKGATQVTIAPVGLDLSLLNADSAKCDATELKRKHGYAADERILLFVGRMIDEKQPLRMVEIFKEVAQRDERYTLLMVGTGELADDVAAEAARSGLQNKIRRIDRIPNSEIWELYRLADAFVNLNQQEIFGMAILEAMYYGCKVVAWSAPGPNFIIEDGVSGCLCENDADMVDSILHREISAEKARERIMNAFTWHVTAGLIAGIAKEEIG